MQKKIIYLIIPFMIGCNYLLPQSQQPPAALPTQGEETTQQPTESALQANATTPQANAPIQSEFTITRINISNGSLYDQLAAEAQKATTLKQIPILEFDATWCPPCIAIEESLQAKDQITLDAFAGTYIIRADVDEWGWGDKNKFNFDGIPMYYKLDENGNPTGATIDGNAWGDNIPKNFAPVLGIFFHTP